MDGQPPGYKISCPGQKFGGTQDEIGIVGGRCGRRPFTRVAGLGTIAFVRDADAGHLLVCMASLVGKWVREVLMSRVTRFHRAHDPSLPEASGYHDPVTTRFIEASLLARRSRNIRDDCFERRALPDPPPKLKGPCPARSTTS